MKSPKHDPRINFPHWDRKNNSKDIYYKANYPCNRRKSRNYYKTRNSPHNAKRDNVLLYAHVIYFFFFIQRSHALRTVFVKNAEKKGKLYTK